MINANELRIGNWVHEAGEPSRIYSLDSGGISFYRINDINVSKKTGLVQTTDDDRFNPIALTPEILEQCGFRNTRYNYYQKTEFGFYKDHTTGFCLYPDIPPETATKFKYLHQLQNLYFALTGQELPINLLQPTS